MCCDSSLSDSTVQNQDKSSALLLCTNPTVKNKKKPQKTRAQRTVGQEVPQFRFNFS